MRQPRDMRPHSRRRRPGHRPSASARCGLARFTVLATLAGLGACGDEPPAGLSRERFVEAYVAMVRARIDSEGDSASFGAARDQALRDAGVTVREMRDFVEAGRREPEELRAAWQAIVAKLDTLYGGVTSEPPPALRSAAPAGAVAVGGAPGGVPAGALADSGSMVGRTAPPNIPPDTAAAVSVPGRTAPPNIPPDIGPAAGQSVPPDDTD